VNAWKPEQPEQVLSTLNADGSRRWMRPRVSSGRFLTARRWLGYALIALFVLMPYLQFHGKPLIFLNLAAREFTFFGFTLLPTDTLLLAIFMVGLIVSIFLVTALLGRIWCGWMCPQLVYLEFVYRPIEYLLEGVPGYHGAPGKRATPVRTMVKYVIYLLISFALAHVFLAYFVSVEQLWRWVHESPFTHPLSFIAVALTTGLMMFDFCFFREQTCILACPYGRLQSAMLDRDSLIISYDAQRGEPRGRLQRTVPPGTTRHGDCIDCDMCVDTCPTGIDIRNGLQLECVACAQCIDACDAIMDKIKKPRGLIRYSSQAQMAGERKRIIRPRVIVYPLILLSLLTAFGFVLSSKDVADVKLLRGRGRPFFERTPGQIANQARLRITNRADADATYTVRVAEDTPATIVVDEPEVAVAAGESKIFGLLIVAPRSAFQDGRYDVEVEVSDGAAFRTTASYRLMGPRGALPAGPGKERGDGR
jgi:cytochrome c oxidase accessory protein FixG